MKLNKKTVSGIVACLITVAGLVGVVQPFLPPEAKQALLGVVAAVNFLAFSPVVKFFEGDNK